MKLLGIDFESTGKDPQIARITEIGALLKYLPPKEKSTRYYSKLLFDVSYPPQSQEVIEVTGITDEMLKSEGVTPPVGLLELFYSIGDADYIFAHNKEFDKTLLYKECARWGLTPPERPWICTMTEVPYPDRLRCRKLSHLAIDHGIAVDPAKLHRAVGDVELMLRIVDCYPFPDLLRFASESTLILEAKVVPPWTDSGKSTQKAKERGFRWQETGGKVYAKRWVKSIKKSRLENEIQGAEFEIVILEEKLSDTKTN